MNLLQSFMGCMYPGSIRTESIESMDHDYPELQYHVTNIDERGKEISRGELQLTDRDLIYFIPGRFPTCWRIECLRKYGCTDQGDVFVFEAGRSSPTGEATFAFRINRGHELVKKLREKIQSGDGRSKGVLATVQGRPRQPTSPTLVESTTPANEVPEICAYDNNSSNAQSPNEQAQENNFKPISYVLIDFDTTRALSESAQAHAANRDKSDSPKLMHL